MATAVRIDENGYFRLFIDGATIVLDKETAEELFWDLEDALREYAVMGEPDDTE